MRITILILATLAASPATAAQIVNADADARTITVTEQGIRTQMVVQPAATLTLCEKGCFIALPDGEMLVLKGDDRIAIVDGKARPAP